MAWKYETTEEEEVAAAMLRGKGWSVKQPSCPDCHGMGVLFNYSAFTVTSGGIPGVLPATVASGDQSPKRCPRGCPQSAWYFPNTASSATFPR